MATARSTAEPIWSTGENRAPGRVARIVSALEQAYPDARLVLQFNNPFELLAATILAAQAADERVNLVTPDLFARWPDAPSLAAAPVDEVAHVIRSIGMYHKKAERLVAVSGALVERFAGAVPATVDDLVSLPGVGKKTAIMVINHAFGIPAGIAVDTHVYRIAQRFDWSHAKDPDRMEGELRALIPEAHWITIQDLLAAHGRALCKAPAPRCAGCALDPLCYTPDKVNR